MLKFINLYLQFQLMIFENDKKNNLFNYNGPFFIFMGK